MLDGLSGLSGLSGLMESLEVATLIGLADIDERYWPKNFLLLGLDEKLFVLKGLLGCTCCGTITLPKLMFLLCCSRL